MHPTADADPQVFSISVDIRVYRKQVAYADADLYAYFRHIQQAGATFISYQLLSVTVAIILANASLLPNQFA